MRALFDTSVLIAAMVDVHPAHEACLRRLQRAKSREDIGLVAAHSLAELYSVLTTLPVEPRIPPSVAQQLIKHNVLDVLEIVSLSADDYIALISHLSGLGLVGGATYDGLILHAAAKENVDQVLTLNERDFRRVYPELADRIVIP